jgi:putative spermidine/putrescine transport system substrate-binding protein
MKRRVFLIRSAGLLPIVLAACGGATAAPSAPVATAVPAAAVAPATSVPAATSTVAATVQPVATSTTAAAAASAGAVVVSYNTPEKWANWGEVLKAFSTATGVQSANDPKNSGQTLAALEAEKAAPQADTAYYGIVFGIQAAEKGLVEAYKPAQFDAIPAALKDPNGAWMTVHQGTIAFLVNTKQLGGAPVPKCWSDLTKPEYAGKVGMLDPAQAAIGYSVAVAANQALGGSLTDFQPALTYFGELKKAGLQLPAQTATAMVQQGEIPILIDADFNGYKLKNVDNAPVEVVIPCEGSLSVPYVMSLVKGAPHAESGKKLIDFALSDEGQKLFAASYLRPIRDVPIDPKIAAGMLPASAYEKVSSPDFAKMREVQKGFVEQWKAQVASK